MYGFNLRPSEDLPLGFGCVVRIVLSNNVAVDRRPGPDQPTHVWGDGAWLAIAFDLSRVELRRVALSVGVE